MVQYHKLIKHVLENGTIKKDRTGTGTRNSAPHIPRQQCDSPPPAGGANAGAGRHNHQVDAELIRKSGGVKRRGAAEGKAGRALQSHAGNADHKTRQGEGSPSPQDRSTGVQYLGPAASAR